MPRSLLILAACVIGCSGSEPTGPPLLPEPAPSPLPGGPLPAGPPPVGPPPFVPPPASPLPVDPPKCTEGSTGDVCVTAIYSLTFVDNEPLPVPSPSGIGAWDYDEDAGTWKLTSETITLYSSSIFRIASITRAASGAIISETVAGAYERATDSILFSPNGGNSYTATIDGENLIVKWTLGPTFVYSLSH